MVQHTDDLRSDMQARRVAITDTVEQIQNRVSPGHVAARGRYRVRTRMGRWKDSIMGQAERHDGGMRERAGEVTQSMQQAPSAMERYTRGNPVAVGLIAVGAGALLASMLPETRQERRMAERVQPEMEKAASEVGETGRGMAEDMKGTAQEGMSRVQESAKSAGEEMKDEAKGAGEQVRGS